MGWPFNKTYTHNQLKYFEFLNQLIYVIIWNVLTVVCAKLFWTINPPQLNTFIIIIIIVVVVVVVVVVVFLVLLFLLLYQIFYLNLIEKYFIWNEI